MKIEIDKGCWIDWEEIAKIEELSINQRTSMFAGEITDKHVDKERCIIQIHGCKPLICLDKANRVIRSLLDDGRDKA